MLWLETARAMAPVRELQENMHTVHKRSTVHKWLETGTILKRWLSFACNVISMAHMEVRKMLVAVFSRKNTEIRDSFRPVVQHLCNKYSSGVDQTMYADLPYLVRADEEEPLGDLGEIVQL